MKTVRILIFAVIASVSFYFIVWLPSERFDRNSDRLLDSFKAMIKFRRSYDSLIYPYRSLVELRQKHDSLLNLTKDHRRVITQGELQTIKYTIKTK